MNAEKKLRSSSQPSLVGFVSEMILPGDDVIARRRMASERR